MARVTARYKSAITLLVLSLVLSFLSMWLGLRFMPVRQVENWLADLRVMLLDLDVSSLDNPVVMLVINEATLEGLPYRSPIDRQFLAETLATLDKANPRAVGLDVLLDQATEQAKDTALFKQMGAMQAPLYVAWAGKSEGLTDKQVEFISQYVPANHRAIVNLIKDNSDGTVRQVKLTDQQMVPAFSSALSGVKPKVDWLQWPRKAKDSTEPVFPKYPAHMASKIPPAWLKDKIVIIGADLPMIDRHRTSLVALFGPTDGMRPGAEIHAQAVLNQLNGLGLQAMGMGQQFVLIWLFAVLGLLGGRYAGRAVTLLPLPLVITAALIGLDQWVLHHYHMVMWLSVPLITLLLAMGIGVSLTSRQHRAEKQFIRKAMSHYVAPEIVSDLQKNPGRLALGGQRQPLTMVFTDIAGFTSMAEAVPAELLVSHLNRYLDGVSRQVTAHGGIVDKFIGDAVVALFNAPLPQADHARAAVACALAIDAFAQSFQQEAVAAGLAWGQTRIGVHTDEVIVGNMGGLERFDYTAIGDGMNTAARLEGANKYLGTRLCISERTVALLNDAEQQALALWPIGRVQLVGQSSSIMVYCAGPKVNTPGITPDGPALVLGGK